uniref:Uncharacterized protein n=1 Tax=Solanum lycopersicum TaxID=4081 RepID=A0A3Q7HMB6_SOLLC
MPHPMSFDRVCCPKAMMACQFPTSFDRVCFPMAVMLCHSQCSPTVCTFQWR